MVSRQVYSCISGLTKAILLPIKFFTATPEISNVVLETIQTMLYIYRSWPRPGTCKNIQVVILLYEASAKAVADCSLVIRGLGMHAAIKINSLDGLYEAGVFTKMTTKPGQPATTKYAVRSFNNIKHKSFNTLDMKRLMILALSLLFLSCYRKQFKACTSERIALQAKAQAAIDQHLKVDKSTGNLRRTNAELDIKNLQDKKRNDSLKIVINSIKRP